MKIKKGFVLRDVAGRSVVVATGAAAKRLEKRFGQDCKKAWIRMKSFAV